MYVDSTFIPTSSSFHKQFVDGNVRKSMNKTLIVQDNTLLSKCRLSSIFFLLIRWYTAHIVTDKVYQ